MAASMIIPPWLSNQGTPLEAYAQGIAAGQRARAQDEAAIQFQNESIRRDQELAIQQEYHQQQMDLARADQERAQQEEALKIQQASRKYAAQQQYQQLISGGMNPADAMMQLAPQMGMPLSGLAGLQAQMLKARAPQPTGLNLLPVYDPSGNPIPDRYSYVGPTGRPTPFPRAPAPSMAQTNLQARLLESRVKALEKLQEDEFGLGQAAQQLQKANPKLGAKEARDQAKQNIQSQIDALNQQLDSISGLQRSQPAQPPATTPATAPAAVTAPHGKLVSATKIDEGPSSLAIAADLIARLGKQQLSRIDWASLPDNLKKELGKVGDKISDWWSGEFQENPAATDTASD